MTVVGSIRRPRDKRKTSLSFCYWLISQVRVGNWLTQWQRSHLSHHWQPTALSSSNFLQSHQIVAMIASSHPGSIFFSWQHAFPSTHLLFTASASKEYWRGEINVEFQVKGKKKSTECHPSEEVWQTRRRWWRCLIQKKLTWWGVKYVNNQSAIRHDPESNISVLINPCDWSGSHIKLLFQLRNFPWLFFNRDLKEGNEQEGCDS